MVPLKSFDWALEKKIKASCQHKHLHLNRVTSLKDESTRVFCRWNIFSIKCSIMPAWCTQLIRDWMELCLNTALQGKMWKCTLFFSMHLSFTFNLTLSEILCYHHNFPYPKVTSANCFFCPASSLKPKDSLFTVTNDKERQKILTFLRSKLADVWHFYL